MDLRTFLDEQPRGAAAALAERLNISRVYLMQLVARQDGRLPSPELCVLIEFDTVCKVRRWDLRPKDWHRIWPELIDIPEAPAIPVEPDPAAANDSAAQRA